MPHATRHHGARRHARQPGFTLIELLLVLAILVILMGLVGTRILGSSKKANVNATKAQLGMFKPPLESYALDMKTFPSTEDGLQALIKKPADPDAADKWDGPYLDASQVPKDPWGHDFQYEFPPSHSERDFPDIWSLGPDGEEGTDDDIVNWSKETGSMEEGTSSSSSSSSSPSSSSSSGTSGSSGPSAPSGGGGGNN